MFQVVNRVILSNISMSQGYFGKVSDAEAIRWIENLYD